MCGRLGLDGLLTEMSAFLDLLKLALQVIELGPGQLGAAEPHDDVLHLRGERARNTFAEPRDLSLDLKPPGLERFAFRLEEPRAEIRYGPVQLGLGLGFVPRGRDGHVGPLASQDRDLGFDALALGGVTLDLV